MTALAILDLLPPNARRSGLVELAGETISALDDHAMDGIRGRKIGMIFQEPAAALNPVMTIGRQVAETIRAHSNASRDQALRQANEMLTRVGLPVEVVPRDRYPHQLSGGQCQRVSIAAALVLRPALLIADEPTTALDVTTQAEIIGLLRQLVAEFGMSMLLISHDRDLVAGLADTVVVMREGRIIDVGSSRALLAGEAGLPTPRVSQPRANLSREPVLEARNLVRIYRHRGRPPVRAVDGVDLSINRGERVALVGESGSGKSTLMRSLLGLEPPQAGEVLIGGASFFAGSERARRPLRRQIQAVFQDPVTSFDPRWQVEQIVSEPMALLDRPPGPEQRREAVATVLEQVGLSAADMARYPHQFSGGQRQRLAIARALIIAPALLVLDEATSALDAALKAEILELVRQLSDRNGLACLLITHDLGSVWSLADRVLVMRAGRIIEAGTTETVLTRPRMPYTQALVRAARGLDDSVDQTAAAAR
jgi:peptide/nickel transport system ATP-binding protein